MDPIQKQTIIALADLAIMVAGIANAQLLLAEKLVKHLPDLPEQEGKDLIDQQKISSQQVQTLLSKLKPLGEI